MVHFAFQIGDRVRIKNDWFVTCFRGVTGTVSRVPQGVTDQRADGVFWIEFDNPVVDDKPAHPVEAAEIDGESLERI